MKTALSIGLGLITFLGWAQQINSNEWVSETYWIAEATTPVNYFQVQTASNARIPYEKDYKKIVFTRHSEERTLVKSTLCQAVSKNDFREVEKIIRRRAKHLARDKGFKSNRERLDSLENWLAGEVCIADAYWNKNVSFILTTTTYTHRLDVIFDTPKRKIEKCYSFRTGAQWFNAYFFWKFGWRFYKKRLKYLGSEDCEGFIKRYRAIDSANNASTKLGWHVKEEEFLIGKMGSHVTLVFCGKYGVGAPFRKSDSYKLTSILCDPKHLIAKCSCQYLHFSNTFLKS